MERSLTKGGIYFFLVLLLAVPGVADDIIDLFAVPTHDSPILNATHPSNSTLQRVNLTAFNQSTADTDDDHVRNVYDWRVDGESIAILNAPLEANGTAGGGTYDYSSNTYTVTPRGGIGFNATEGPDGNGVYNLSLGWLVTDTPMPRNGTICLWFNIHLQKNFQQLFGSTSDGNHFECWLYGTGELRCRGRNSKFFAPEHNWYHMCYAWDLDSGVDTTNHIYINGTLADDTTTTINAASSGTLFFGADTAAGATPMEGYLDEILVFNRSLSQEQVQALYNNQSSTMHANELQNGENWTVMVTPNDGTSDGASLLSNELFLNSEVDPSPILVNISSDDFPDNTTLANLTGSFLYNGSAAQVANMTKWYNDSVEVTFLENYTYVQYDNITFDEEWIFSARVDDGTGWSDYVNASLTVASTPPTQAAPILNATHVSNSTLFGINLTAFNQSTNDIDPQYVRNIYDWRVNGTSIAVLNAPLEGNGTPGEYGTYDYSSYAYQIEPRGGIAFNRTEGYDGRGAYNLSSGWLNTAAPQPRNGTICMWFNLHNLAVTQQLLGSTADGNNFECWIPTNGDMRCRDRLSPYTAPTATWQHMCYVWDYDVGNTASHIYVNGTLADGAAQTQTASSGTLFFGADTAAGATPMQAYLDEIIVYNHSLSAEEVLAVYENQTSHVHINALAAVQNWTVAVTGNDNYDNSDTLLSNELIVVSSNVPIVSFVNLTSDDGENLTGSNLTGAFSYFDVDGDANSHNETVWYNNSLEVPHLANFTTVTVGNTTAGESWIFSVRVSDGALWSDFVNSSAMEILSGTTSNIAVSISNPVVNSSNLSTFLIQSNMSGAINLTNVSYSYILQGNSAVLLGANDTAAEENLTVYAFAFDSTTVADGIYTIVVNATDRDTEGAFLASTEVNVSNVTIDNTFPNVSAVGLPTSGQVIGLGNDVIFNATVDDSLNLSAVYFNVTNVSGAQEQFLEASLFGVDGWNATFNSTSLVDGFYNATVFANDTSDNLNDSEVQSFFVNNFPPAVTAIRSPSIDAQNVSGDFLLNVTLSEAGTYVDTVFFNITNAGTGVEAMQVNTSNLTGTDFNGTFVSTNLADATYTVTVYANDTETGNLNSTENITLVVDNTVPSVSSIGLPTSGQVIGTGDDVLFNATITDASTAVDAAYFNVTNSSGHQEQFLQASILGADGWNATFNSTSLADGFYNVTVFSNDTLDNRNDSEVQSFFVNNFPPAITAIRSPTIDAQNVSGDFLLNVTLSEAGTYVDVVFFNLTNATSGVEVSQVNTSNLTGTDFNATFATSGLADGTYTITIYANDTETGNLNSTENITFVIDNSVPIAHNITLPHMNGSSGTNFSFNVSITEEHIDTVIATIESPDENETMNVTMFRTDNSNARQFNGTFNSSSFVNAVYNIDIFMNDTLGNSFSADNLGAVLIADPANTRGVYINTSINYPANTTVMINATDVVNVTLEMFMFSATTGSVTITSQMNNVSNSSLSGYSLGHYLTIDLDNGSRSNLTNATISLYHTGTDILTGANASNISIYRFNTTNSLFEGLALCSVNTTVNSTSCTTTDFSTFGASASASAVSSSSSSSSSSSTDSAAAGAGSGGGGGGSASLTCENDAACTPEERCIDDRCHRLFNLDFVGTPVQSENGVAFSYSVKGLATIAGDVLVEYWLEQDGEVIISGERVEQIDYYEEKTSHARLFADEELAPGVYDLFVRLTYENDYTLLTQSKIEVGSSGEITTLDGPIEETTVLPIRDLLKVTPVSMVKKMLLHVHNVLSPRFQSTLKESFALVKKLPVAAFIIVGVTFVSLVLLFRYGRPRRPKKVFSP